jgi:hypothetical protein
MDRTVKRGGLIPRRGEKENEDMIDESYSAVKKRLARSAMRGTE